LTEKAIDKPTKKRQAICRLREGFREGERVANLFSLPDKKFKFKYEYKIKTKKMKKRH